MKSGIVWADCEMTGLDIDHDALIEIAVLVTDDELNILGDGVDLVIHADNHVLETMNDVVKNMHNSSGLTQQVQNSTVTIEQAQDCIMEYIKQYIRPKGAPLAGNSIATDRAFIARDLPIFHDYLHYRMIDVSSIKELTRRWYPEVYNYQPAKGLAHRALADIKESIAELQYYRKAVFVPAPGYNSEKLIEIRDEVQKLSSTRQ